MFAHSPASSISSMSSVEPEYVLVKPTARSAPYQPALLPAAEPARASGEKRRRRGGGGGGGAAPAGVPIALVFDAPGAKAPVQQPRLLRVAPSSTITTHSHPRSQAHAHAHAPLSPSASAFNIPPLSPLSPLLPASPLLPSSPPPHPDPSSKTTPMNDRQKRRKMAKLARTLGENVPPELVFRPAPPTAPTTHKRRASLFAAFTAPPPVLAPQPPVLAVAATPAPIVRASSASASVPLSANARTVTGTSSWAAGAAARVASASRAAGGGAGGAGASASGAERTTEHTPGKRRAGAHRPRSLALGAASAIAAADAVLSRRAAASMDVPPVDHVQTRGARSMDVPRHPRAAVGDHMQMRGARSMDVPRDAPPFAPPPQLPLPQLPAQAPASVGVGAKANAMGTTGGMAQVHAMGEARGTSGDARAG